MRLSGAAESGFYAGAIVALAVKMTTVIFTIVAGGPGLNGQSFVGIAEKIRRADYDCPPPAPDDPFRLSASLASFHFACAFLSRDCET